MHPAQALPEALELLHWYGNGGTQLLRDASGHLCWIVPLVKGERIERSVVLVQDVLDKAEACAATLGEEYPMLRGLIHELKEHIERGGPEGVVVVDVHTATDEELARFAAEDEDVAAFIEKNRHLTGR